MLSVRICKLFAVHELGVFESNWPPSFPFWHGPCFTFCQRRPRPDAWNGWIQFQFQPPHRRNLIAAHQVPWGI